MLKLTYTYPYYLKQYIITFVYWIYIEWSNYFRYFLINFNTKRNIVFIKLNVMPFF